MLLIYFVFALTFLNNLTVLGGRLLLTLNALDLGAQPFTIGMLATTFALVPMLLSWHSGRLSDRFGTRLPLTYGAVIGGLSLLVPYFSSTLPAVFVSAAVSGFAASFLFLCTQNLVGLLSKPSERAGNYSNYSLVNALSAFIAPVLVGYLIDRTSYATAFLTFAVLSAVPAVLLVIWGAVLPRGSGEDAPSGSLRDIVAERGLVKVLTATSLINVGQDLYKFYLPVYAHSVGIAASLIGVILAVNAGAAFVVRIVMRRMIARLGEERLLAYSFFIGAASLMMIPFFKGAVVLSMISFMFGIGMGCGQPIITMLMFSRSPPGRSGEAMGVRMAVIHCTRLVSPAAFGALAAAFGLFPIFWVNALLLWGGGALSHPKKVR